MRNGMIPTVIGTVVTATGFALRNSNIPDSYKNGLIGFGLAQIAMGSAEMLTESIQKNNMMGRVTSVFK
ncbi:asparagine synthase [Sedimentibacter sp.]|uniref:asparagine synthase n=1 Tax=Sedimentibacter sp. TaxID=1960295 RepID=UPI0028A81CCF|nr:asparagine synthase [Sedimentibacter sp.]